MAPSRRKAPAAVCAFRWALLPFLATGVHLRAPRSSSVNASAVAPAASTADGTSAEAASASSASASPAEASPAAAAPSTEAERVERLLFDIDESVRKAGSDAEYVYATLYTYDQQLQANLEKEIARVDEEVGKLKGKTSSYNKTVDEALQALGSAQGPVTAPAPVNSSAVSSKAIEEKRKAVEVVQCFVREGDVQGCVPATQRASTPTRKILAEEVRIAQAVLREHQKELRPSFGDVYAALVPDKTAGQSFKVHLTSKLRARTAQALTVILKRLEEQKAEVLLQESARVRLMSGSTAAAEARAHAREGLEAEVQQNVEEVAFSLTFAEAVLRIDKDFLAQVRQSVRKKADLVEAIRECRNTQHQTLSSVVDLLKQKYAVSTSTAVPASTALADGDAQDQDEEEKVSAVDATDPAPSFLQAGASTKSTSQQKSALNARAHATVGLQLEVEDALGKNADTHDILLRVKAMLDHSAPVDAESVGSVVGGLRGVLTELEGEKTRAAEVSSICDAQAASSTNEEKALRANLVLMKAARNRTLAAVAAAKQNLAGILRKSETLERSMKEVASVVNKASSTLEDEAHDRGTMMAALSKVRGVVEHHTSGGAPADALILQMMRELRRQDEMELAYRAAEASFKQAFMNYAGSYIQLLHERHDHYTTSLSALDLYANEVDADLWSQTEALGTRTELEKQSSDLCAGLRQYYEKHRAHAADLAITLGKVVPDLPAVLSSSS